MDEYGWTWLQQRVGVLEGQHPDMLKRIIALEQQVANQAVELQKLRVTEPMVIHLKGEAARWQAMERVGETDHLYAPLRSDTKPLLEMSAFVRSVAAMDTGYVTIRDARLMIGQAREILKRST